MTARDWPKGPGQDSLVQRRKEQPGVSLERAPAQEKGSLGLELEPEQEQQERGQQEQEPGGKQQEPEPEPEQGQEQQPQGVGEELDISEVEWLVLKV